jgi:cell division septum initiation protein DivIVA
MMEVVQEEIPQYLKRIEDIRQELDALRSKYSQSMLAVGGG